MQRSDINVPDKDEFVPIDTYVLVDGKGYKKVEWITQAEADSLAEEIESEERLVYDFGGLPKSEID